MKKAILLLAVVVLCSIVSGVSANFGGIKFCIDPGHGGSDPGAVGYSGSYEKTHNLEISLRARDLFELDGANVVMTRDTDVYLSLAARCDIANNSGAVRFISQHCNGWYDESANGTETYCHPNGSSHSFDLRNRVNYYTYTYLETRNRGEKTADFYVLRNTTMPSILTETVVITNQSDEAKLLAPGGWQTAARAMLHGTQEHYGIPPHDPVQNIIIDNLDPEFYASANWSTGSYGVPWGPDYRWRMTEAVSDRARWTPDIPVSGSWKVYAWWVAGSNRSTQAPYQITHSGGTSTVLVNQQINGSQWNLLGTFNFGTGNSFPTFLSCWTTSGYVIIADAIKWVKD